jgi:hypothetical protein
MFHATKPRHPMSQIPGLHFFWLGDLAQMVSVYYDVDNATTPSTDSICSVEIWLEYRNDGVDIQNKHR